MSLPISNSSRPDPDADAGTERSPGGGPTRLGAGVAAPRPADSTDPAVDALAVRLAFAPSPGGATIASPGWSLPRQAIDLSRAVQRGVDAMATTLDVESAGRVRCLAAVGSGGSFCDADGMPRLQRITVESLPASGAVHLVIDVRTSEGGAGVWLAPRRLRVACGALPPRLRGARFDVAATAVVQAFWSGEDGAVRYRPVAHGTFVWRRMAAGTTLGAGMELGGVPGLGGPVRRLDRELRDEGRRLNGVTLVVVRFDLLDDFGRRAGMIGRAFASGGTFSRDILGGGSPRPRA